MRTCCPRRSGITRTDLLAMAAVLVALSTLVWAAAASSRGAPTCKNNLLTLSKMVYLYAANYGGYLPAFWHERWVGEMDLVGKDWGKLPHDRDARVPTVWDNPVPNPIGGFPVRTGARHLVCPDDRAAWRCDQGCHVSYMGLAKYGWWHRSPQRPNVAMFEYHQIQEFDHVARRVLLAETEPAMWQVGLCGCRWLAARRPAEVLDRHNGGGLVVFFDGHVSLVRDPARRRIRYWEPDYEKSPPWQ